MFVVDDDAKNILIVSGKILFIRYFKHVTHCRKTTKGNSNPFWFVKCTHERQSREKSIDLLVHA